MTFWVITVSQMVPYLRDKMNAVDSAEVLYLFSFWIKAAKNGLAMSK